MERINYDSKSRWNGAIKERSWNISEEVLDASLARFGAHAVADHHFTEPSFSLEGGEILEEVDAEEAFGITLDEYIQGRYTLSVYEDSNSDLIYDLFFLPQGNCTPPRLLVVESRLLRVAYREKGERRMNFLRAYWYGCKHEMEGHDHSSTYSTGRCQKCGIRVQYDSGD